MISPDPWAAMLPARPIPSATRFETRPNWWELSGASVASTAMMLLAPDPGELVDHPLHRGVAHLPDAQRVGEEDGRLHQAPFDELRHAAHLARPVQHEPAPDEPLLEDVLLVGEDGRDAGPHRPLPAPQRARAPDDGRVTDQDAFHVGDGVPLPGPEAAQGNP